MTYEELMNSPAGEFVMFASKDGKVRIECRRCGSHRPRSVSYTAKPKLRSAGISRIFLMRVSWSKIQLFGFTEQLPAMVKHITFNMLACPSFLPSAIASAPREVHSSASGPPKRCRNIWLKASLWTTSV